MNRITLAAALATAVGLAIAAQSGTPARAADNNEKCYGVNAVGKNDCAAGVHSCAGQASKAMDPASFVLLPKGVCDKIAGGHLQPM
ncbi:MAG TPA: DUF2282 domain-containing protein [Candidatus Binatia bacterium]|nr:DUF2282 domain-containing protein [Candidatus Binatia bacterium]